MEQSLPLAEFVSAAVVPKDTWHKSGNLTQARTLLRQYPQLPKKEFLAALVYGEREVIQKMLQLAPELATRPTGPYQWEPILYLCFSEFLRLDPERRGSLTSCLDLLLEHGANPNAFFMANEEKETALYGLVGISNATEAARLLLQAGADPNDEEVSYHGAEFDGVDALGMLIAEFGMEESFLTTSLLRKLDFEDPFGTQKLLDLGIHPNWQGRWGKGALHQALIRDRSTEILALLLEYGADPNDQRSDGLSAYQLAGRLGRTDILPLMQIKGAKKHQPPKEFFLSACARGDKTGAVAILQDYPETFQQLDRKMDLRIFADLAHAPSPNLTAFQLMIDLGFPLDVPDEQGFTALHWAGWTGKVELVKLLLDHGAPLEVQNTYGGTVIDSTIWGYAHHPDPNKEIETVLELLIEAGADLKTISPYPTGDPRLDRFLEPYASRIQ